MDIKKKGYIKYVVIFFLVIAVFFAGAQMLGNKSDDAGIGDGESTGGSGTVVADFDGGGDLGAAGGEVGTPDGQFADVGGGSYGGEGADTFDGATDGNLLDVGSAEAGGGSYDSISAGGVTPGPSGSFGGGSSKVDIGSSDKDVSNGDIAAGTKDGSDQGATAQVAGGKTDTSTNTGSVGKGSSVKGANRYEEDEEESSEDTELLDDKLPVGGTYTSKSDVALYIHTYHKLPVNFITKKQAKSLGWTGGSLEEFAPGKCIGGDSFGNYEGMLPTGVEYHECDIGTLGASERGPQRIVYSDDFHIYYTPDHYNSFELLYSP